MVFENFINSFWSMIESYVDFFRDSRIASYLFGGITLWLVLITFFCAAIVIKFFINSSGASGGLIFNLASSGSPQHPYNRKGGNNG